MILEQRFLESDLAEVEQILSKSVNLKIRTLSNAIRKYDFIPVVCVVIIFACSIGLTALGDMYSKEAILIAAIGVIGIFIVKLRNRLREKMKPENMLKRRLGQPFTVVVEEDTLVYKQIKFLYTDIRFVVEYKDFLFIKTHRGFLIMKTDEEEREVLFRIMENKKIRVLHEEEPFNLRKFG